MECISFLQNAIPFSSLPKVTLIGICSRMEMKTYPKNSFVFKKGETSHATLYIVFKGLAEVVVSKEDQEIGVSYRKPGDFFGETVFLSGSTYPASVKVIEDMSCFLLKKEAFDDLCVKHPDFARHFSHILSERMRAVYQELMMSQAYELPGSEANLFRHPLRDMMTTPVATCYEDEKIQKVAEIMVTQGISSMAVVNEEEKLVGLISEKDLVKKCLTPCSPPTMWPTARETMNPHPAQLSSDDSFHLALLTMIKNKCKHVLVTEKGALKGIVSMGDLVRFRSMGIFSILEEIENQTTLAGLRSITPQLDNILKALASEKASPVEICELITEYKDRIQRKVLAICEQELLEEGLGLPPAAYCWMTMGSGGRKEQLLTMDQNSGIIYEEVPEANAAFVKEYFLRLANKVVQGLLECGYAEYIGEIIANEAKWCASIEEWESMVASWAADPSAIEVEKLTVFLDFRYVYGRKKLADRLRNYAAKTLATSALLEKLLAEEMSQEIPTKIFERPAMMEQCREDLEGCEINLQKQASHHVVRCIRIFALREGIIETPTIKRLQQLIEKGVIPKENGEYVEAAYQSLVIFRLKNNLEKVKAGQKPDNMVQLGSLSVTQHLALKESMIAVSQLQRFTKNAFQNSQGC